MPNADLAVPYVIRPSVTPVENSDDAPTISADAEFESAASERGFRGESVLFVYFHVVANDAIAALSLSNLQSRVIVDPRQPTLSNQSEDSDFEFAEFSEYIVQSHNSPSPIFN